MPYSLESKEKDTHSKGSKQDNASQAYQLDSQGGATAPLPDEGLSAGSGYERLFAFIREAHLEEAQEFRLKGYNSQVPEVDEGLLTQLRDGLAAAKSRLCVQISVGEPLGSLWLLEQIGNIERLTSTLSDDVIKRWIEHELPRKNTAEAAESELGSRRTAQSLARRLEATLQMLIRIVRTLRAMDDYSTSEKRRDMLATELTDAFSSYDKSTVIQALGDMTLETSGHAAWVSLMQARAAAWEVGKSSSIKAMIAASRYEAEKVNKKALELQGDPQTFFSHVATYLQNLSSDLAKASIHAGLSTTSPAIPQMSNDEAAASIRSGYSPPIKLNKNNKWIYNTNIGMKRGRKDSFLRKFFGKNKQQSLQTHESSTAGSVPNLPASTPQRQVNYNLTSDIDAAAYLEELKQDPKINNKIMNPAGQCESLVIPVREFMKDKGFDNIRYRGMFIWDNATQQIPGNHFAVVGNKGGKDYVFDISAHQFESKGMSELNGPLILSAEEWVGKYSGATKRKLIYYTDFSNAREAIRTYDALPRDLESESKSMVVKVFVTSPSWYDMALRSLR